MCGPTSSMLVGESHAPSRHRLTTPFATYAGTPAWFARSRSAVPKNSNADMTFDSSLPHFYPPRFEYARLLPARNHEHYQWIAAFVAVNYSQNTFSSATWLGRKRRPSSSNSLDSLRMYRYHSVPFRSRRINPRVSRTSHWISLLRSAVPFPILFRSFLSALARVF